MFSPVPVCNIAAMCVAIWQQHRSSNINIAAAAVPQ